MRQERGRSALVMRCIDVVGGSPTLLSGNRRATFLGRGNSGGVSSLRFGRAFDVVDVADSVNGSERLEGEVVAFVEVADFYDILIE